MIQYRYGDMFDERVDALVNPVNCVGTMGAGLAKKFKQRYPEMNVSYVEQCKHGTIRPGRVTVWPTLDRTGNGPRYIFNFPTKAHWQNPSTLWWIVTGLASLREMCDDLDIRSIAIPALGCGLGGLDWEDVKDAIEREFGHLHPLGSYSVYVYPPQ